MEQATLPGSHTFAPLAQAQSSSAVAAIAELRAVIGGMERLVPQMSQPQASQAAGEAAATLPVLIGMVRSVLGRLEEVTRLAGERPDCAALTPREREILDWIAKGKSNAVIAQILGISRHTVDTYNRRIFKKLGTADRTTAAIKAMQAGLVAA